MVEIKRVLKLSFFWSFGLVILNIFLGVITNISRSQLLALIYLIPRTIMLFPGFIIIRDYVRTFGLEDSHNKLICLSEKALEPIGCVIDGYLVLLGSFILWFIIFFLIFLIYSKIKSSKTTTKPLQ